MSRRIIIVCLNLTIFFAIPNYSLSQANKSKCFEPRPHSRITTYLRSVKRNVQKLFGRYTCILVNLHPNVDRLILSRGIVDLSSELDSSIEVTTEASDPENDVLTYVYDISGGRVVGNGGKVVWDLKDSEPGSYSIRAWVDDGLGDCGRSLTQTIVVVGNRR